MVNKILLLPGLETKMTEYNLTNLRIAENQTLANLVALADEKTGTRAYSAVIKAITEIRENKSINFNRETQVLSFVSRYSNRARKVTAAGCYETCCCGNVFSYHQGIFAILKRYYELEPKERFAEQSNSPYLKPSSERKIERIAGIRI